MAEDRNGTVVTFYAYRGGTGRTMALANVAWILAANGKRVLVADWELESPGLHRFFAPFLHDAVLSDRDGVIDLIRAYELEVTKSHSWQHRDAIVKDAACPINWDFPDGGRLDFLGAGRQNDDYVDRLSGLYWAKFHEELDGAEFLAALRDEMRRDYDYALIDSRSGESGLVDICTLDLPDVLVDCFTLGSRAIADAVGIVHRAMRTRARPRVRILPVPMRVDAADEPLAARGRADARHRFAGLPAHLTEAERAAYWSDVEVPYQRYFAYEEVLAAFGDVPADHRGVLDAYQALTAHISGGEVRSLPPMDEARRRAQRRLMQHGG